MAKKNAQLRDMAIKELESNLAQLKSELAKDRSLAMSGTKAEKPAKIRNTKRQIARIFTIMREKSGVDTKG